MTQLNQTIEEWCKNTKNIERGLYLVVIQGASIPVKNQTCPYCTKGWAEPVKFAAFRNRVCHRECLERRLGKRRFELLLAEKKIITE